MPAISRSACQGTILFSKFGHAADYLTKRGDRKGHRIQFFIVPELCKVKSDWSGLAMVISLNGFDQPTDAIDQLGFGGITSGRSQDVLCGDGQSPVPRPVR